MKILKVFVNGKHMRDIYPHATKWQVFKYRTAMFFRVPALVLVIAIGLNIAFYLGAYFYPAIKVEAVEVAQETETSNIPPVMMRIGKCESVTGHYDSNGQVVMNPNKYSVDIGKYQINDAEWGDEATKMGLDLTNEQDNETMALWIYENYGTEPWYLSKSCWNK